MKPYQQQNHYEILEVPPGASEEQIRTAYQSAMTVFGEDALGIYSLVEGAQAEDFRLRLKSACTVLLDGGQREAYDRALGFPTPPPAAAVSSPVPAEPVDALPAPVAEAPSGGKSSGDGFSPFGSATPAVVAPQAPPPAAVAVPEPVPPAPTPARSLPPRPRFLDIAPEVEFNGELLRRIREESGRTLVQVADTTRITRSHLENVEADRYSALPAPVYLRGILVNLARELGLDPMRVSKSYLALAKATTDPKLTDA